MGLTDKSLKALAAAVVAVLLNAAPALSAPRPNPPGTRAPQISLATLQRSMVPTSTVDDSWLGRPEDAVKASNRLNGRIALTETTNIGVTVIEDTYDYAQYATRRRLPPNFVFEYATLGDKLIPVQTGLQLTGDLVWNLIFTEGDSWDEPNNADDGWSRVSIPFALSERNANCIQNGVMLFAFKSDGSITDVRFQVTQETCKYFKVDYWGQLPATYQVEADSVPRFAGAVLRHVEEEAFKYPVKSIKALATDYPGVNPAVFGAALSKPEVAALGVVVKGTHYVGTCVTRTGSYAGHCDEMILPSYSTSKCIFAGFALMRLSQLYGPSVYSELIKDWLPVETQRAAGNWDTVTFLDALNMATGNYNSGSYQRDEDSDMDGFFTTETYADKIAASFKYRNQARPGTKHIYHTTDTFIVTTAMNKYLQGKEGSSADIWTDVVVKDILTPIRVNSAGVSTQRSYDNVRAPFGGYGCWWTTDAIAKITAFVLVDAGRIGNTQILDPIALAAAMQQTPSNRGLNADKPDENLRYNYAFWAKVYPGTEVGCGGQSSFYQPYFSGFGGIRMVLVPNGITYWYVSDGGQYEMTNEIREVGIIEPICQKAAVAVEI